MAEWLSKLDYNNDQKISADELKKALEDKFFDDQKNIEAITKAMQHNESEIKIMMTQAYKDYLENLDTDKLQVLYRDEWSVASKKLFQLASTNILWINSLFGKTITIDWKIWDQGKTLINLLYITWNNQADPQLISSIQNLTTKLKKHNLTIFELFEWSKKEYIQFLFKQNPYLISQALDTCPNLDIFSSDYPLNKYLTEYINTNWNLSEETKQMFSKAQKYFEDQKKYQTQKEQFKYKHNDIFKIYPKQIADLRWSLNNLSEDLQCAKDNYNSIYAEFVKILESNNSIYQKIKDISPILLLPTMPSLWWDILWKSSLSAEEKKQLKTYNNLKKSYEEVKSIEKQIQKVQKNIETKEIKRVWIYYELLRDYGNQKDADQALINLVAKYGTVIQEEYEDEINKASKRVWEVSRAILKADKQQLQKYMKQKSLAIDIAQQILSPSKAVFKKCNQESIKHLWLWQIESLLSQDQKIQAVIWSRTTAVSDNTAVARHWRTADYTIADGNIMWTQLSYQHTEGKTSVKWNEMANMYQLASKQFQYLDIPGVWVILTRIQPSLYQQILDTKLSPNQKIVYNPQYNKDLEAFELCESDIYVWWKDTKWDIGYRPLSNQNTSYIKAKEYQSLLQVKEWYNTIVKQNEKIKSVSEYMTHLSETANNIQQIANTYAENPWDEVLSEAIIADITKPDGLQSQLKWLRKMLFSNDQYKSIIDEIIANKWWMYDHHEKELHAIQKQLQSLNQYAEELDKLLNYSVWEGAESRNLKEFVVRVVAIAVWIWAASLTWWFGILATTMIMTGVSMVSARATQDIFARSTDTKWLTNDLHSDIVKCINNQEKRSEVIPNIALEFVQWTVTTAIFIWWGRIAGKQLEKFVLANAGNTSLEVKIAYRTRKAISKLNDQEVQLLEKRWFSLFMKNFWKEFAEEWVESSAERWGEKWWTSVGKWIDRLLWTKKFGYIGWSLSSLVSMVTCISGKRWYRAGGVEVFMEWFDPQNQTTTVSY